MIRPRMTVAIYTGALIVALSACGTTGSIGTTPAPTGAIPSAPAPTQRTTPNTTPPAPGPAATEINPPGDIPDNQAFVTYKGATGRYVVKVPEGWSRTAAGQSASFTDKLNSISVAQITQAAAPTVASVTATEVPALQARVPQFSSAKVTTFTRPGGSGVMVTYLADSAPNPVTNKVVRDAVELYIFWKNGQQVSLALTGPQNADNVDPWAKVSGSFRWTP